ncbi:dual oxidase maturation factor 1-like isoform X1 [Branchiostoma floridae]|uniref:Dual oxidase maturation factor 1-like isoform X1 n=1 Tax=Branchiostoma floridae TaxID=7739 RepID=A0A9J7KMZ8_BRAFL|nr:dual oxidase maturation factor 1-like isoform X1 [Branchiostoma floridae]
MGFFDFNRVDGGPTLYASNKTAVTVDVLEIGFIFAICILAFSFLVILPGVRGMQRLYFALKVFFSIFVLAVIMLGNFGMEWEVSEVETGVQYKAFHNEEIHATIGVKIGLRAANITLKGDGKHLNSEKIDYNERFWWGGERQWTQGRNFFGPFAGLVNREFREAQFKGLPYPILWIAEYFTLDGENIRWGRSYRLSGFYAHIMLWTAFPLWILTNILFCMFIRYGAYFMMLTGGVMLLGNILFAGLRFGPELKIPIGTTIMTFHYGWCFWLTLAVGLICVILGAIILFIDLRLPDLTGTFFGVESDPDEYYTVEGELTTGTVDISEASPDDSPKEVSRLVPSKNGPPTDDNAIYENYENPYRRRISTRGVSRFQKSRKKPVAAPRRRTARSTPSSGLHPDSAIREEPEAEADQGGNVAIQMEDIQAQA